MLYCFFGAPVLEIRLSAAVSDFWLETGILGTRQVVCYKGSDLSYRIAMAVVKDTVKYISLVNLVMDAPVVTELIQYDFTVERLKAEMDKILFDETIRQKMSDEYTQLLTRLGGRGASARAAEIVVKCAKNSETKSVKTGN